MKGSFRYEWIKQYEVIPLHAEGILGRFQKIKIRQKGDGAVMATFESRNENSNDVVCATSQASDQPAHMRSLIRAFASRLNIL